MTDSTVKRLEAKCHCGSVHLTLDVPEAKLPLPVHLCHCSLCRYMSGSLAVFHTRLEKSWPLKFVAPSSPDNMTSYTAPGAVSSWTFCSTCGCHISSKGLQNGSVVIASSIFADHGPANFSFTRHIYNKSTKDGGLSDLLSHVDGHEIGEWNPPPNDKRSALVEADPETGADGEDRLRAQCQCGGVSFTFKRPTQWVYDDEFMSKFTSPVDKTKWPASMDVCDDCRLTTGSHLIAWTFLPLSFCEPAIGPDLKIGTSKTYSTSPGVLRSFCGDCGATVFYSCDERNLDEKRQVADLAIGLVRAPEGVMAENWFTWRSRIAWADSGIRYDGRFMEALQEGMNRYVVEKSGKELTFNIG